jgi:sugar O-acyltransferase (sialic acid O-acetyltransferase NeuD family)
MKPVVIFGAGDIAEVAKFYFAHDSGVKIAAFTVDGPYISADSFCGCPLVPFEDIARSFPPDRHDMFVAISYTKVNVLRAEKCTEAKFKGYRLISYVSSRATVWSNFAVGENCFILEDNTIQPFAKIGNNVTLWSGNHVGHHAQIGDNCFITSHVVISGGVRVGRNCFIGVNSTIRDHIEIGDSCVIGAGSLIVKDTPKNGVYSSTPAELSKVPSNRLRKI